MPYVTSAVPISFQELEDSEWRPLTAGAGDGWGGHVLQMALRQQLMPFGLLLAFALWPCFGMHLKGEDPL